MDVERPTTDDVDALTELWIALAASQREHGSHVLGRANESTVRQTLAERVVGDRAFVVRDGGIVGFVTVGVEDDAYQRDVRRGLIENIYVRPEHRGEGVASALLDRAERALVDRDVDVVALEVLSDNEEARRLYEERGYRDHRRELEKPL